MEDKDTELLCKLSANHLFLAQFEPFRATLRSLRARNPELSRAILQTIVAHGGRFDSIIWSHSCPSPALLTFLCTLELLQFNEPTSQLWSFDAAALKLRAEFCLYLQNVISRVSESISGSKLGAVAVETVGDVSGINEDLKGLGESLRVLVKISDMGMRRLRPDLIEMDDLLIESEGNSSGDIVVEEEEMMCLRRVFLENADIFDVVSLNIEKQVGWIENEDSDMAITVRTVVKHKEVEDKVLKSLQKCIQIAHLDAMRDCLMNNDVDGAVSHIQFLHLNYGINDEEYRVVSKDLLRRMLPGKDDYGDAWREMRDKFLSVYGEALSSRCTPLVKMIQVVMIILAKNLQIQFPHGVLLNTLKALIPRTPTSIADVIHDEMLLEEIESVKASESDQIPLPLQRLQKFIRELNNETTLNSTNLLLETVITSCMREMYQYARVRGVHVLECVMDTALSAVRKEELKEASDILLLLPRLQPLLAVLGWDLLSGKTGLRRKLMQLLWTSKSQVLRLEDSPHYRNTSDEVSCVEHLCDLLCYQLDLASFVACVNSGKSWSLKSSLLLSGKEFMQQGNEDVQWDPFVENFVLERLSVQSPLRVLFDVVPSIKFQDAIELISMQPITSNLAAWRRMEDIELMHMRYALESSVLALGEMEKNIGEGVGNDQINLCYLKDLKNHLDAINNIFRKNVSALIQRRSIQGSASSAEIIHEKGKEAEGRVISRIDIYKKDMYNSATNHVPKNGAISMNTLSKYGGPTYNLKEDANRREGESPNIDLLIGEPGEKPTQLNTTSLEHNTSPTTLIKLGPIKKAKLFTEPFTEHIILSKDEDFASVNFVNFEADKEIGMEKAENGESSDKILTCKTMGEVLSLVKGIQPRNSTKKGMRIIRTLL
ncbi:hypothetical protein HAX54_021212 [Datura stramonium]|uniref:Uncharacterized protein n=1 Tax=Datura stramonium TaxID=4076 RepID=A0ABS8S3J0_DATST|nr:hypothetical protein [Datura stramonium]